MEWRDRGRREDEGWVVGCVGLGDRDVGGRGVDGESGRAES